MRLLRAELARLFSRRFTRIMLLLLVLALSVITAVLASETHAPTAAELQRAEALAADERARCEAVPEASRRVGCASIQPESFLPYALNFHSEMPDLLMIFAALLTLFGFLVGASFLGAEWSFGGMSQLLLWRVERTRVLLSKLLAVLLALAGIGVAAGAAWTAAIWFISHNFGRSSALTAKFWMSLGADAARGLALALLVTAVGVAVASLGRRTAAALGLLMGYLVVWELGARLVMEALEVRVPDRFMLSSYAMSMLHGTHTVWDWNSCVSPMCEPHTFVIRWPWALALIGGISLLMVLASVASFRRRDVA